MKKSVDLILHNAIIYSMDNDMSVFSAIAVKDGLILELSDDNTILNKYKSESIVDLEGLFLYPGFNDSHGHLSSLGQSLNQVDLRGVTSMDQLVDRVLQYRQDNPDIKYIYGFGWDQNLWDNKKVSNSTLNSVIDDIPVVLYRVDLHSVLVNNRAIDSLSIYPGCKSIPAGEAVIERGAFTGEFLEGTADRFRSVISEPSEQDIANFILLAQQECFKLGLTSVSSAGSDYLTTKVYKDLQDKGLLKIRTDLWISPDKENLDGFSNPYISDRLRIATLKLFADGALGSRGAWLLEPYSDNRATYGVPVMDSLKFRELCNWAVERGFNVATHCIGDAANRFVLDEYGKILKGKNDLRWRVEHAQIISPDDLDKFGQFSIIPSIQPTHATSDMGWVADRLGDRERNAYIFRELLDQNGWLPTGTDFPIEDVNPLFTFISAVFRTDSNLLPEGGYMINSALTREEALLSMTLWGAKATFEESVKGSLEPGKYADFTLLNCDLLKAPLTEIAQSKVIATYVAGQSLYSLLP